VYFALVAVENLLPRREWVLAAFCVLATYSVGEALYTDTEKVSGLEPVARYLAAQPESDVLYYQGFLNGDFIFYVRKYDPQKRRVIAREKQIVATKVNEGYGTRTILRTPEEVIQMFQEWGIRYAVVENREVISGLSPARVALQSDQFEVIRSYDISSNIAFFKDRRVTIYRYKGELKRSEATVTVPMMTLRDDIKVNLNRLAGRPWPN
jgi:hypothetical protein